MKISILTKLLDKYKEMPIQAKASIWFFICLFLQKACQFVTTPIFTRIFSAAEYGAYGVFTSWQGIAMIIVSLNLSWGVYTQGLVKFEEDSKKFSSSLQGLTFLLCLIWGTVLLILSPFLQSIVSISTNELLCMIVLVWTSSVFGFWSSEQRVKYNYKAMVCITLLASILEPLLGIILIKYFKRRIDAVFCRILGMAIIEVILYGWMFIKQILNGKVLFSKQYWRYALKFNMPLVPHYLSLTILNSSDRIMISNIVGEGEAGIYSLAYSIGVIMTMFSTAIMNTLRPWIYQRIKAGEEDRIAKIAYICIVMICCANILLILITPEAVRMFAPIEYQNAKWIIPPVATSTVFIFLYDLFSSFEFYFEKTKLIMAASSLSAIANILLNYIFINIFGYFAAGYTTLICYGLYALFHYIFMTKITVGNFNGDRVYNGKLMFAIVSMSVIISSFVMTLYSYAIVRYLILGFAAVIIFLYRKRMIRTLKKLSV